MCEGTCETREKKKKLEIQSLGHEWQGSEHVTTYELRGAWPGDHCSLTNDANTSWQILSRWSKSARPGIRSDSLQAPRPPLGLLGVSEASVPTNLLASAMLLAVAGCCWRRFLVHAEDNP